MSPHLRHHPAHPGDHPAPGGHPGGRRPRLPLRRLPPRCPTRPPPTRHPRQQEPAPHWGPNLGAPNRLGATPSRTPHAGAGGHPGPHPLPRAKHGPSPTQRQPQQHQRVGAGNMGSSDDLPEQLQAPRPRGHPQPRQPAASPLHVHDPHVQSALHPLQHPLRRTNWPLGGARHRLAPPRRLRPPPPTQPRLTRTPERTSRMTPKSGARANTSPWTRRSSSAAATRALVGRFIALPSGPNGPGVSPLTGGCGRSRCAPSREGPPRTAEDPPPNASPPYSSALTWWQPAPWPCCGRAPRAPPKTTPTSRRRTCPASSNASFVPRPPPANAPTRPEADMDDPQVTHVPAQPRQCHHTSTSTHRSPGKARADTRCPNQHARSHYLQDPASYARL